MSVTLTGRALVASSMRLIGSLASGETASAADERDALAVLNQIVDTLDIQHLAALTRSRITLDLVANQTSYTIGPSGDLVADRPVAIESAMLRLTDTDPVQEQPLEALTPAQFQAMPVKTLTIAQPTSYYYEPTSPDGTLYLFPIPDNATNDVILTVDQALTQWPDANTEITLPPAYAQYLRFETARLCAIEWGKPIDPEIKQIARDTLLLIKQRNVRMADLNIDPAFVGGGGCYNIYTDSQ